MEETIMTKLFIIKIGGNVIDNDDELKSFLKDFSHVEGRKILVHGGGKIATAMGEKLGIVSKYVDGRRITDDDTIDLVTMVYGGLVNKKVVAQLQSLQCNAIGITGADGNLIPATKRPVKEIDFGWVGDIENNEISTHSWKILLDHDFTPVVAPLTHNRQGQILNTNADTIASALSVCLSTDYDVHLIYCFEKNGVLKDIENENSVIEQMNHKEFESLKAARQLFAGILPKIENAFSAIDQGVKEVIIGNSRNLKALISGTGGTKISK